MNMRLLSRDEFRESVFKRDNYKCVRCKQPSQDAHHILERRLFPDGGYYLDNGASLCGTCHLQAEQTIISCEHIRECAGIKNIILPPHLYQDNTYTKWGDIILSNGRRVKGELFFDESVQKILKQGNVLDLYCDYVKYPRTYHLPWSEGLTDDDRVHPNLDFFNDQEVVITEKMDGENTNIYQNYFHARSIDGQPHWSQSYVRNLQGKIGYLLPDGWRICGENLYAKHSIKYINLPDFFLMFSIWNEKNECLSWDDTVDFAELLEIKTVPFVYRGPFSQEICENVWKVLNAKGSEGYVVRLAKSFNYGAFKTSVAKFVRKNHVNTSHHWKFNSFEKNEIA